MHRLFLVTPDGHIRNVDLSQGSVTLGRAENNVLSFPDDNGLSRHHLTFEEHDGAWRVRDLGSKNGTLINGTRVDEPHELQPGERVRASHVVMTYQTSIDGGGSVSFDGPAPFKTELTHLDEILSPKGRVREDGALNWVFVRAGRELAQRRPLPELFSIILDLCLAAVTGDRGVLFTVDDGGSLAMQASRGGDIHISTTVRDKVLSERASLLVRDVGQDESIHASSATRLKGVCSLVAVPLQSDERVIGMIYLDSCDPARRFTREDMNVLTALANIAGIRIELEEWEIRKRELISDNVESLGRLTAALSHELNTPLGALKSGLDTLWRTTKRGESLDEGDRVKLERLQADLRVTLDASLDRMQSVISRIQRFANLDRAETRSVDLKELLEDVVALAETAAATPEITLECEAMPRLTCHPQPLSSAIASLLAYALDACQTDGVTHVDMSAHYHEGHEGREGQTKKVEIRIEYEGGEVPPEQLERLFQPSFEIARQRMEARNWSLFSARQVVRDQGGDVSAFSAPGKKNGFVIELSPAVDG